MTEKTKVKRYWRKGYTRKDGTKIKGHWVKEHKRKVSSSHKKEDTEKILKNINNKEKSVDIAKKEIMEYFTKDPSDATRIIPTHVLAHTIGKDEDITRKALFELKDEGILKITGGHRSGHFDPFEGNWAISDDVVTTYFGDNRIKYGENERKMVENLKEIVSKHNSRVRDLTIHLAKEKGLESEVRDTFDYGGPINEGSCKYIKIKQPELTKRINKNLDKLKNEK
jgi:DNA-binding transcriptional regulator YhcF (GntR family)